MTLMLLEAGPAGVFCEAFQVGGRVTETEWEGLGEKWDDIILSVQGMTLMFLS